MIEKPTPREIAFRLIASYHGGSKSAEDVFDALDLTVDDLAAVTVELVQIAGGAIGLLSEQLEGLSFEDMTTAIERSLDELAGPSD